MKKIHFNNVMVFVFGVISFIMLCYSMVYGQTCTGCSTQYPVGQKVTLTNTPNAGYYFAGWISDVCSGTGRCIFTMPATDVHVEAINAPLPAEEMTLYAYGKAGGRVISSPAGMDCTVPNKCIAKFPRNTKVTLTSDAPHKWRGFGCAVTTSTCIVTMSKSKAGNVQFY